MTYTFIEACFIMSVVTFSVLATFYMAARLNRKSDVSIDIVNCIQAICREATALEERVKKLEEFAENNKRDNGLALQRVLRP